MMSRKADVTAQTRGKSVQDGEEQRVWTENKTIEEKKGEKMKKKKNDFTYIFFFFLPKMQQNWEMKMLCAPKEQDTVISVNVS